MRPTLTARLAQLVDELKTLEDEEQKVTARVHDHRHDIRVIQDMIAVEDRRVGDTPLEPKQADRRLLTMSLADIAEEFFQEELTKDDMFHRLLVIGYDFGSAQYPKRAVHGGWIGAELRRKQKRIGEDTDS